MEAKRVFEGLTVVAVGLILLGNTTGALPWSVWWTILGLWPLLIVSAGLDLLGVATKSTALRILASLVVIAGLAYGVLAGTGRVQAPVVIVPGARQTAAFSYSQPRGSATTGSARIDAGAAKLTVAAGGELATAEGRSPFGRPSFSAATENGTARVDVNSADGTWVGAPGGGTRSFLDVTLDRELPWADLRVNAGAADVKLDLSDLRVRRLDVNVGMSSAEIGFGTKEPQAEATVNGGMSSLRVRVPRDLGVEVRADNGLGSVNVRGGGWTRTGGDGPFQGSWRTDGYDSASAKLTLVVKTGLSSVDVERY